MLRHVELQRVVALLARQLEGHRIQEIAQPDAQSVVLGSYGQMDPDA
ncbi:MAG: hypothetical protein IH884_15090, partial [Myxococcales bacterium]|nr:hypothetical protein [Myxococcales bacterium]